MPIDEIGPDSEVTTPTLICACAELPATPAAASIRPNRLHFPIGPSLVWRSFDLIPDALSRKRWGTAGACAEGSPIDLSPVDDKLRVRFPGPHPGGSLRGT